MSLGGGEGRDAIPSGRIDVKFNWITGVVLKSTPRVRAEESSDCESCDSADDKLASV